MKRRHSPGISWDDFLTSGRTLFQQLRVDRPTNTRSLQPLRTDRITDVPGARYHRRIAVSSPHALLVQSPTNHAKGPLPQPKSLLQVGNGMPVWGDYDNDGFLDLFITGPGHCRLFRNTADGNLLEVTAISPVTDPSIAQSAAWADYDNDGDLDLFVASHGDHNYLYQNNSNGNHWLKVRLNGTASNTYGVGARIFARSTEGIDAREMRQITAGSVSQEFEAHFGLGDATKVDTLRIEWPSGIVQELKDVAVDQIVQVVESQGLSPESLVIQQFDRRSLTLSCPVEGVCCVLETSVDLEHWSKVKVQTSAAGTVQVHLRRHQPRSDPILSCPDSLVHGCRPGLPRLGAVVVRGGTIRHPGLLSSPSPPLEPQGASSNFRVDWRPREAYATRHGSPQSARPAPLLASGRRILAPPPGPDQGLHQPQHCYPISPENGAMNSFVAQVAGAEMRMRATCALGSACWP